MDPGKQAEEFGKNEYKRCAFSKHAGVSCRRCRLLGNHRPSVPDCWGLRHRRSAAAREYRKLRRHRAQYAGRLHRLHPTKRDFVIYDCVDAREPMLLSMSLKRRAGYRTLGYTEVSDDETLSTR
jgi:hypothetical protein